MAPNGNVASLFEMLLLKLMQEKEQAAFKGPAFDTHAYIN